MPRTVDCNPLNEQMGCIQKPKNFFEMVYRGPSCSQEASFFPEGYVGMEGEIGTFTVCMNINSVPLGQSRAPVRPICSITWALEFPGISPGSKYIQAFTAVQLGYQIPSFTKELASDRLKMGCFNDWSDRLRCAVCCPWLLHKSRQLLPPLEDRWLGLVFVKSQKQFQVPATKRTDI